MGDEVGIAVSVYDKFDDLAILHDIVRENFEGDYFLSVHCNHPDAEEEILEKRDLDIDYLSHGEDISDHGLTHRFIRILNSFRESCRGALEECEYVMHLHADAWPLEEGKLQDLVEKLENSENKALVRGRGPTYQLVSKFRTGLVMDQFFLFDADYFQQVDFFDFDLLDPLPHWGIHDSLMILLLGKIGRSKIHFYSDMSEDIYWDGKSSFGKYAVRPSFMNPEFGFFHCARGDFPENYGKEIQAMRLRQKGIEQGENIEKLLDNYQKSREDIIEELASKERKLNLKLALLLFRPSREGRMFKYKEKILEQPVWVKLRYLVHNLFKELYYGSNKLLFKFLPYPNRARRQYDLREIAGWPEKDSEIYREEIHLEEIEKDISSFWFNDQ